MNTLDADHIPDAHGKILLNAGPSEAGAHRQESFRLCEQKFAYRYEFAEGELAPLAPRFPATQPAPVPDSALTFAGDASAANPNAPDRVEEADQSEAEAPHLIIGSLGHIGFAHYFARIGQWQRNEDPERYYSPTDAIEVLAGQNPHHWQKHVGLACDIVRAHAAFWPRDAHLFRVIAVERVYRVMVGAGDPRVVEAVGPDGFVYTQRFDLVLADSSNRVYVWDHKGVGHMRGGEDRVFCLSGQFLGYQVLGDLIFGANFAGVRVNIFERKAERPRFRRIAPKVAPFALQCFRENLVTTELDIRARRAEKRDPWQWRKAYSEQICRGIYGFCEHFERCRVGPAAK